MGYKDEVLADSPLIYYEYEGTSGTLPNLGSLGGSATVGTGVVRGATGIPGIPDGKAYQFNGTTTSHTSQTINTSSYADGSFSVEVWVKIPSKIGQTLVYHFNSGWWFSTDENTGRAYIGGGGLVQGVHSGVSIIDGEWHHIVVTTGSGVTKMYLDGQMTTYENKAISVTSATQPLFTSDPSNAQGLYTMNGVMDEFALYPTALSAARVEAHYLAGLAADKTVTDTPMAGEGSMADPVVVASRTAYSTNFSNDVDDFFNNATESQGSLVTVPSRNLTGDGVQITISHSDNRSYLGIDGIDLQEGGQVLFKIGETTTTVGVGTKSGTTYSSIGNSTADNYWLRIERATTTLRARRWNVGEAEPATWNLGSTASTTVDPFPVYLRIQSGSARVLYASYNELGAVSLPDVAVSASALTASALFPDAVASTYKDVLFDATPAVGNALFVDASFGNVTNVTTPVVPMVGDGTALSADVDAIKSPSIEALPMLGTGLVPMAGKPALLDVDPAEGSGIINEVTTDLELNGLVLATPATATGRAEGPLLIVNDISVDPDELTDLYYRELIRTTDDNDFWYRLDEVSGSTMRDARGITDNNRTFYGDFSFDVFGPEGRRAVHFENGYAARTYAAEPPTDQVGISRGNDFDTTSFSFEIVLKTTDGNGLLMYGLDRTNPTIELNTVPYFYNSIFLRDGKVGVNLTGNNYGWSTGGEIFELVGFTDVADGQWHHIVVSYAPGSGSNNWDVANNLEQGLRIYVDGKLDRRRNPEKAPGIWATPDSYFGMPQAWKDADKPRIPIAKNFVGDVMEVAWRHNGQLARDDVNELYYAVFGYIPVRPEPLTGSATLVDPVVKGNRKRALVLYTKWEAQGLGNRIGQERNAPSGVFTGGLPDEFDHNIDIGKIYEPGEDQWEELAGYRVVPVPIMRETVDYANGPYRDPVTDTTRLINLQEDLNMGDYDLIVFRNWPDEGKDRNIFYIRGYTESTITEFLDSVKQAVVDGTALHITNVGLAAELGLISSAKAIPIIKDKVGPYNEVDQRGALINPWVDGGDGLGQSLDMHNNNVHRVVSQVENLTDLDVYHMSEVFLTYNDGRNMQVNHEYGYKLDEGPLAIGDEIYSQVYFWLRQRNYIDMDYTETGWNDYVWAITPDGLRVGTPVYKFATTYYKGLVPVDNPYKDYIGGAVVQPGDLWGDVRISGKVFMNFGESPWHALHTSVMRVQDVPPNSEIVNPRDHEDESKREWDYATYRVAYSGAGVAVDQSVQITQNSEGLVEILPSRRGGPVGINEVEKYPTRGVIVPSWSIRGLAWLASTERQPEGSVLIRPLPMEANTELVEPAVVAQRSVTVSVGPAYGAGVVRASEETTVPDVEVSVLPMLASARMTGYGRNLDVGPMDGSGEIVYPFDMAEGEQVVLTLYTKNTINLYILKGDR